jgi:membrane-bound lytic murein transglycosylase A
LAAAKRTSRAALILLGLGFLIIAVTIFVLWPRVPEAPPTGVMRLTPVSFSDLDGWSDSDPRAALSALRRSCAVLKARPDTALLGGAGYAGTARDWRGACAAAQASAAGESDARGFFEHWFEPIAIATRDSAGLFTGYYEPEIRGSHTRHGAYQSPVYGLPNDLVTVDLGLFRKDLKGETISGHVVANKFVPFATRGEIEAQGLKSASVLFYSNDPVAVFFLHIQGSGRVHFDDGTFARVAYAGQNGHPYTAIGRTLIARGDIDRAHMSMQSLSAWLRANPKQARAIMDSDASYIFFSEAPIGDPKLGANGAQGLPLTPGASIAVDPRLHALGTPFFLDVMAPNPDANKPARPLRRLMIAQDTGGAIRGPIRGDIFFGFGPRADSMAGRMKSAGKFYVLVPKPLAEKLAPFRDYKLAGP